MLPALNLDPKFILELAAGMEDPDELARRYHLTDTGWANLKEDNNFQKVVEAKRTELQKSGYTFRLKAALAAESLLDDIYLGAKDMDASLSAKLEAFKYLTKLGGLEPKEDKGAAQGTGFTIRIDLSGDSTSITVAPPKPIIDVEAETVAELPDAPTYLLKTLPLTNDLNTVDV